MTDSELLARSHGALPSAPRATSFSADTGGVFWMSGPPPSWEAVYLCENSPPDPSVSLLCRHPKGSEWTALAVTPDTMPQPEPSWSDFLSTTLARLLADRQFMDLLERTVRDARQALGSTEAILDGTSSSRPVSADRTREGLREETQDRELKPAYAETELYELAATAPEILVRICRSETVSRATRAFAVEALGELEDRALQNTLFLEFLRHEDPMIRESALHGLSEESSGSVLAMVRQLAVEDGSAAVRLVAAEYLREVS